MFVGRAQGDGRDPRLVFLSSDRQQRACADDRIIERETLLERTRAARELHPFFHRGELALQGLEQKLGCTGKTIRERRARIIQTGITELVDLTRNKTRELDLGNRIEHRDRELGMRASPIGGDAEDRHHRPCAERDCREQHVHSGVTEALVARAGVGIGEDSHRLAEGADGAAKMYIGCLMRIRGQHARK